MVSIAGCDCGDSLARALGGFARRGSVGALASPIAECVWCGARNAQAESAVVNVLADLARRN